MDFHLLSIVLIHIASLFIVSACSKILSFSQFVDTVIRFQILPEKLAIIWARVVPIIELIGALLLLHATTRLIGVTILMLLLCTFLFAVWKTLKSKQSIDCGCYGRMIGSKVDSFTVGKIVYFLFLLIMIGVTTSMFTVTYSFFSIFIGLMLTILLLFLEWTWTIFQETMKRFQQKE